MKNYLLGFICISTVLYSCKEKQKKDFSSPGIKAYTYSYKPLPDTLLPPEIVELTGVNTPQSFIIKPTTVPLKNPNGVESFSFKKFDVADGLSGTVMPSLTVDHSDNLWMGGARYTK